MMPSTGVSGASFTICMTTFCVGAGEKPSTVKACTASSTSGDDALTDCSPLADVLPDVPINDATLSFRSTIMRCAALGPMPLTPFKLRTSSVCTMFAKSAGVKADNTMRAVCPPMPETPSNSSNKSRSMRVANPKSRYASSRITS